MIKQLETTITCVVQCNIKRGQKTTMLQLQLTIRLLVSGTSTNTSKLLWLTATRIGNEEGSVKGNQFVLDYTLGCFINILLVKGNNGLCQGLSNSYKQNNIR